MRSFKEFIRAKKKLPTWLFFFPALLLSLARHGLFRFRIEDRSGVLPDPRRLIAVAWHNRLLYFAPSFPRSIRKHTVAVVSASRDGQYVSDLISFFGIGSLRGSSKKGGANAQLGAIRELDAGKVVVFTPDGPRGPKYSMSRGPVHLASTLQAPIIPLSINASRYWQVKSWDNFQIPKPFSTLTLVLGEPLTVPPDLDAEALERERQRVEAALLAITLD